jgi:hypothetical protein
MPKQCFLQHSGGCSEFSAAAADDDDGERREIIKRHRLCVCGLGWRCVLRLGKEGFSKNSGGGERFLQSFRRKFILKDDDVDAEDDDELGKVA